ncbi:hypothetical protein GCM10007940_14920 [Portibacter lacus]|uniref:Uncharacterized protein n=2 Tax=Portibacter lacus TaxID=1099794 RepID=A0AA37SNA3_9BACT|nr:hypothetical protein GCM10007940_14920 [Portibacter lacus]
MKVTFYILFFFLSTPFLGVSQNLYSLHTQWDDDIKQWEIKLDEGEIEGEIEMTWRLRGDMTDWTYRIDGKRGTIKQKWENNANVWELRSGSTIVKISTVWSGDFSSFRISDGIKTFKIERKFLNTDPIEWSIMDDEDDLFFWYNEFQNDIRDWIIEDRLPEDFSLELKLAAVFVSILHSL